MVGTWLYCGGLYRIDSRKLCYQASWREAFLLNGIGGLVASDGNGGNGGSGQGTGEQRQWRRWAMAMETVEFPTKRCLWHKTISLNSDLTEGALEDAYHFGVWT